MPKNDLSGELHSLIERFKGRSRTVVRDATGAVKLLSVVFGPNTNPTHILEIRDFNRPEDPLARKERLREENEGRNEAYRKEIQKAVDEALAQQRVELTGDVLGDGAPRRTPSSRRPDRWSKRSMTAAIRTVMSNATDNLGEHKAEIAGSNVIMFEQGDQVFKITVSMPRTK